MIQPIRARPNIKPIGTINSGHSELMIWKAMSIRELKSNESEVSRRANIAFYLLSFKIFISKPGDYLVGMDLRISEMIHPINANPNMNPIGTTNKGHNELMIWKAMSIRLEKSSESEVNNNASISSHLLSLSGYSGHYHSDETYDDGQNCANNDEEHGPK
jgi:hypothetical protein